MRLPTLLLIALFAVSGPALAQEECNGGNPDNDGDGYCRSEDCNDFNASIHPGAVENCEDARDNNCNELVDGDDPQCQTCPDADADGFPASSCGGTDCNDSNPNVSPGDPEVCDNAIDDDCDGQTDSADPSCQACPDADGDGFTSAACGGTDCNDSNGNIHPDAVEDCFDTRDNDCDELVDEEDPQCQGCADADGDGHASPTCGGDDCDDANGTVWARPGPTGCLGFLDEETMTWCAPGSTGGTAALLYDVVRSDTPSDFLTSTLCVETDDSDLSALDATIPAPGGVRYYLPRAQNACGEGSLGTTSAGAPRVGRSCP